MREDDQLLWERAEALSQGNISGLLAEALGDFVARREAALNIEDHGSVTHRALYVWGSHSPDGRHASGTSFDSGEMGMSHAEARIRSLQADASIASVQLEERRVYEDGTIERSPLDEWVRNLSGWSRVTMPVTTLGDPYLVRQEQQGGVRVRNIGGGPAIQAICVKYRNDACLFTDFFHCMAGEELAVPFISGGRMWPPKSITAEQCVNGVAEALVCFSSTGTLWRFLPRLPSSFSGKVSLEPHADWLSWYLTNLSFPRGES